MEKCIIASVINGPVNAYLEADEMGNLYAHARVEGRNGLVGVHHEGISYVVGEGATLAQVVGLASRAIDGAAMEGKDAPRAWAKHRAKALSSIADDIAAVVAEGLLNDAIPSILASDEDSADCQLALAYYAADMI